MGVVHRITRVLLQRSAYDKSTKVSAIEAANIYSQLNAAEINHAVASSSVECKSMPRRSNRIINFFNR
jgi:hypothetical protein